MGLFNFFKKKKERVTEIGKINSYFHAIIATNVPYEIDENYFIPLDRIKHTFFKDMDYFFFNTSGLREYLKIKMRDTQYFYKIHFYSICIQPLTDNMQDLMMSVYENNLTSISINIFKSNELNIKFIENFDNNISKNLMPGICDIDDLNDCLSHLYTRIFNHKLKPCVYDILKTEEKFDFSIIEDAKKILNEGEIIDIFYNHYPKGNWISSFTKELVDTVFIRHQLSIIEDKKEEEK